MPGDFFLWCHFGRKQECCKQERRAGTTISYSPHTYNPGIFGAYDIRGEFGKNITLNDALQLGRAVGMRSSQEDRREPIIVARDSRLSSPAMLDELIHGLTLFPVVVLDLGIQPTPLVYFASRVLKASAAIVVTASHSPPAWTGMKVLYADQPVFGNALRGLASQIIDPGLVRPGIRLRGEATAQYASVLHSAFRGGRKLNLLWDVGHGAAGDAIYALIRRLPGRHVLINRKPDGRFPNRGPDPSDVQARARAYRRMLQEKSDAAFLFDGDGDRLLVLDETGSVLWGDELGALLAREVVTRNPDGAEAGFPDPAVDGVPDFPVKGRSRSVLFDVKASRAAIEAVEEVGGVVQFCSTGHAPIKQRLALGEHAFAAEVSGHLYFADDYFGFDDALYAAVRMASILAEDEHPLSLLRTVVKGWYGSEEIRFPYIEKDKHDLIRRLGDLPLAPDAKRVLIDGIRTEGRDGWRLVRAANTGPEIAVRLEGRDRQGMLRQATYLTKEFEAAKMDPIGLRTWLMRTGQL